MPCRQYIKQCPICGKSFSTINGIYCSRKCYGQHKRKQKQVRPCPVCGKMFSNAKDSIYCSKECCAESLKKRITVYCQECGKTIETIPALVNQKKYCSRKCANIAANRKAAAVHRTYIVKPCDYCGKPIQVRCWHSKKFKKNFCSRQCSNLGHRIAGTYTQKPCAYCGKFYEVSFHQLMKRNSKYCSRECMDNGQRTRKTANAYYWRSIAAKTRERDKYTCQRCGIQKDHGLHVHHRISALTFGIEGLKEANDLANLVTLCGRCHKLVEDNPSLLASSIP